MCKVTKETQWLLQRSMVRRRKEKTYQRFGPINLDKGENRINVLVTGKKTCCGVLKYRSTGNNQ